MATVRTARRMDLSLFANRRDQGHSRDRQLAHHALKVAIDLYGTASAPTLPRAGSAACQGHRPDTWRYRGRASLAVLGSDQAARLTALETVAPRTRLLLETPVVPMLLRLSAPNIAEAVARVTFLTTDAIFVSWLGNDALAAVSIVFPLLLMFQTSSASGLGAGVSSSIGRALGAGDSDTARTLAGTAVALSLIVSSAASAILLLWGPALYRTMGANGPTLDLAGRYGAVIFSGVGLVWLMNILANIARGAGNMFVPALGIVVGEACHLVLSPTLILGWGPFPRLGVVGAALGALSAYLLGAATIGGYLCSRRALTRLEAARIRIAVAEARAILQVGAPATASVAVFWSLNFFTTGLIGQLGSAPIAAYGMATRLDTILYPLIFAFGSAVVTMVATAIGAGDRSRAASVAWVGCGIAALIAVPFTGIAVSGGRWMRLFTNDVTIRTTGALYLNCQAAVYPLFSAGLAAVWACYGAQVVRPPLIVSLIRCMIAVGGGWIALTVTGEALLVFVAIAAGSCVYGVSMIAILRNRIASATDHESPVGAEFRREP